MIVRDEKAHAVRGVDGRMFAATTGGRLYRPGTFTSQRWSATRPLPDWDSDGNATLTVRLHFDDACRNGHNTFSMTGDVRKPRRSDIEAGGCMHDEIARIFPELANLVRWHLCSADGPMHYEANTIFLAGDRDCWGGTGKDRELDAARRAAIWPDATDGDLTAEPDELRAKLRARLPALLQEFRRDMEGIGFLWSPDDVGVPQ